ncbi:MAG: PRC-barrel domain-containing protein [Chloroflexota bacterium]|jgi:sporulation protein YlmC with PRC-barrel domain|nr:PRC-barrel domain-containing protein [Chloroflexota bacterium]
MTQRTSTDIGFVKFSNSNLMFENPAQDIRGKDVYDVNGEQIGSVDDLYVDGLERKVRFLEVGTGGFLGIGEEHLLVPVESVTEVDEVRIVIEPGREKTTGSPPFDTTVVPLTASHKRNVYNHYGHTDPTRIGAPRDPYSGGT